MTRFARRTLVFSVCAAGSVAVSVLALRFLWDWSFEGYLAALGGLLALYLVAAWCVCTGRLHAPERENQALVAILLIAALLRIIALFSPQTLSTDVFRYVWDGRVQAAGINPYRFIPVDPALAALRDESIYPNINRADYAHTIYPPTAQLAFLAIERLNDGVTGMKVAMVLFEGIGIGCLIALLRRRGMAATRVLLYAWHPLPIWEFAGAGHVDAIAIALTWLALLAAARRAPLWTGIALAAATLVKYYPLVAAPALYRRWDWRMPLAFAATLVVLYAPYLGAGAGVFGFMSGYAAEEGLRDGSGIWLVSLVQKLGHLPREPLRFYGPAAAVLMIAASLWIQARGTEHERDNVAGTALLAGLFTVLVSPHDPWYFTWMVPFLCFRFSPALFWLTASCSLMYVVPRPTGLLAQSILYVPFLLLLLYGQITQRPLIQPETFDAKRSARPASLL